MSKQKVKIVMYDPGSYQVQVWKWFPPGWDGVDSFDTLEEAKDFKKELESGEFEVR